MAGKAQPIPQGYHTVTPYLIVSDAARAIEFYKKAFGATELVRMPAPGGITRCCGAQFTTSVSTLPISPDRVGTKESHLGQNNHYRDSLITKEG